MDFAFHVFKKNSHASTFSCQYYDCTEMWYAFSRVRAESIETMFKQTIRSFGHLHTPILLVDRRNSQHDQAKRFHSELLVDI
ncbi:hypothetical protein D918_08521 [Trichuris suis]|nr:hypothetical protein D918_08521 [Trichuris suis]